MSDPKKPTSDDDTYVLTKLTPVRDRKPVDPDCEDSRFDDLGKGKFEVIMTTRKSADGDLPDLKTAPARTGFGGMGASPDAASGNKGGGISGDDYTKAYLRRQQEQAQAQNGGTSPAAAEAAKADDKRKKQEQETLLRTKARDLQAQIIWWDNQRESGQYDESHIRGMISSLQSQLGAIPAQYWP